MTANYNMSVRKEQERRKIIIVPSFFGKYIIAQGVSNVKDITVKQYIFKPMFVRPKCF